ncbi:MAG: phosphoribosyltransferase [Candidatus Sungbacteria bacterium]|nr:phosphoribosyltransferase [Candidatus Sungbacteria bacterium]
MDEKDDKIKKQFYTWQEFDEDMVKIAEWARAKKFQSVYGIPRGGLVLAVSLSHRLGIPQILSAEDITKTTLVVDDISDSGKTLTSLEARIGFRPHVATIFWHADTSHRPDFSLREKKSWIVFPWETEVSSKYDATAY